MKAIRLRTEYLNEPIGVDFEKPRLMWNLENGISQTAYQIVTDDYDSGKVESNAMYAIYNQRINDRQRVNWKIRVWDENDKVGDWSESFFEKGISSWEAKWITGNYDVNPKKRYPVDYFRKDFDTSEISKARLYITACGLYEATINNQRVGNFQMAPGITDYRLRIQYQTYDVTDLIKNGNNRIEIKLADGWYRGATGGWGLLNQYGTETKLLAQLEMILKDGSIKTIITDDTWLWCNDGPIRFADNKDGEIVEAWKVPGYFHRAKLTNHNVVPTSSNNVPVTDHEEFKVKLIVTPSGKKVLDFGQNIAGHIKFKVNANAGNHIFMRFGETLDDDGEFTQKNFQFSNKKITTPKQEIDYRCKDGINEYRMTFSIFGFQYVLVDSDIDINPDDFTAIAVYSDMQQTGFFDSSNELLNKFVDATIWSLKGNHLDIPTDCPTRERHGWTGDAQIFFETGAYLFDYAAFSRKYMNDVYDLQDKDGMLPQIAPYGGVNGFMKTMNGSVGWADAGILIPYRFYKIYGDDSLIKQHYDGMVKYAHFMINRCGKWTPLSKPVKISKENQKYLVNYGQSYGEWAEPTDVFPNDWKDIVLPHPEESTAYTAFMMRLMKEIAHHMDKKADADYFAKYEEGCTKAYQELIKLDGHKLDTDRQCKLVRPLYLKLLDKATEEYAKKRLVQAMDNYDWKLGTGFLSTPFILDVLEEIDLADAYKLLENEKMPGWLFMPKCGATTIWESWEGPKGQGGIASLNHYSKGAMCEWLFREMCGIHVSTNNHFIIEPKAGGHFTYAGCTYLSVYGKVASNWKRDDNHITYHIEIPVGCTAKVILPNQDPITVKAGSYDWTVSGGQYL